MNFLQTKRDTEHEKNQKPNRTGIPSYMKQDFETRSGLSYDDVRVHYSSPKPAELGALAYTQGTHVYIGPGQERHLSHELVHVAQQKRGEVRPTGKLGYVYVNDDSELERQADRGIVAQRAQASSGSPSHIIQRMIGMEYQTVGGDTNVYVKKDNTWKCNDKHGLFLFKTKDGTAVTADGGDLEYVTPPVKTAEEALQAGDNAASIHKTLMEGNKPSVIYQTGHLFLPKTDLRPYCGVQIGSTDYKFDNLQKTTNAHPQATVGIRMDKISDLLTNLGGIGVSGEENKNSTGELTLGLTSGKLQDEDLKLQKQTMLDAPVLAKKAVDDYLGKVSKDIKDVTDYNSIVSLLSLLIAYNRQFRIIAKTPDAALNAKNAMPVMSRTSLYDAFKKLKTDNDRDIFIGSLDYFADWRIVDDSPIPSLIGKKILAGERDKKDALLWSLVSVDDWKDGIKPTKETDALHGSPFDSVSSLENPLDKATKAKFHIKESTDIGIKDTPGILAELRGLERGVPYTQWGKIAEQVAILVNRLNEGDKKM